MTSGSVIEITLAEFTQITGEVVELKQKLHEVQPMADAYRALLAISGDPATEIDSLREQVEDKSAKIMEIQEELQLLQNLRKPDGDKKTSGFAKFRKDLLISTLLEVHPELTNEEKSFLHLLLPLVDRMWPTGNPQTSQLEEKLSLAEMQAGAQKDELKRKTEETSKLRKTNEALQCKVQALQSSLEELTTSRMQLDHRIKQYQEQQDKLVMEIGLREEELEQYRPLAKDKYELELKTRDLELQNEKLARMCEALKTGMDELTMHTSTSPATDSVKSRTEIDNLATQIRGLKQELALAQNSLLQEKLKKTQESPMTQEQIMNLQSQIKVLRKELAEMGQRMDDAETDKNITLKKHQQETRDLRLEIVKERAGREDALKTLEQCRSELHKTQEVKMLHARVVAASSREKTFVETLRRRIDELEAKNKFLNLAIQQVDDVKSELLREKQRSTELSEELKRLKPALKICTLP